MCCYNSQMKMNIWFAGRSGEDPTARRRDDGLRGRGVVRHTPGSGPRVPLPPGDAGTAGPRLYQRPDLILLRRQHVRGGRAQPLGHQWRQIRPGSRPHQVGSHIDKFQTLVE